MTRLIRQGDTYTIKDEDIELAEVAPEPSPPPENTRGEPWGWTKGPPYPRGYRKDGHYGTD